VRLIVRLLIGGLLLSGGVFAGESARTPLSGSDAAPVIGVLFAPAHPVFVRLRVEVDGQSLGRFRERAVTQWFRQLDLNHDGTLEKKEIGPFLAALAEQAPAGPKPSWKDVDVDPADGTVSQQEFRAFADRQLGPPLALAIRTESGEVDASLFCHLDLDGDGILTRDELQHAKEALAPLDADDDETISQAELTAASKKTGSRQTPAMTATGTDVQAASPRLPLMVMGPGTPADSIAKAILREYGSAKTKKGERQIALAALGLSSATKSRTKSSGPRLGEQELAQLVVETPPQLELSFQLFDQRHGRPRVSVQAADHPPAYEWQQSAADAGTLVVAGLKVALSAKRTHGASGDMASFYTLRFHVVDEDKNNYLDRKEFAALGLPGADFAAVDANGDGQIVEEELSAFLNKKGNVYLNQVLLSIADESPSLFEFLDTRPDGRLSPRELNAAPERLRALDRNLDGNLTLGELRTQISIDAEVKRPADNRGGMRVLRPRQQPGATPAPRDLGPEWFRRMDRNFDGDVSWREFLGPRSVFDRLDTDHDGLLSPEEAERAK
jgi:Ca2+-binding EF-hand superfamily protein